MDNIALAKTAWSWLEKSDADRDMTDLEPYFDLLSDDVVLKVDSPEDTHIYGSEIRGKKAVMDMYEEAFTKLIKDNNLERPLEFVGSGERVVVLGSERYTIRKNGVVARNKEFAIVMDFSDGKIVGIRQVGDMSEYVLAHRN